MVEVRDGLHRDVRIRLGLFAPQLAASVFDADLRRAQLRAGRQQFLPALLPIEQGNSLVETARHRLRRQIWFADHGCQLLPRRRPAITRVFERNLQQVELNASLEQVRAGSPLRPDQSFDQFDAAGRQALKFFGRGNSVLRGQQFEIADVQVVDDPPALGFPFPLQALELGRLGLLSQPQLVRGDDFLAGKNAIAPGCTRSGGVGAQVPDLWIGI